MTQFEFYFHNAIVFHWFLITPTHQRINIAACTGTFCLGCLWLHRIFRILKIPVRPFSEGIKMYESLKKIAKVGVHSWLLLASADKSERASATGTVGLEPRNEKNAATAAMMVANWPDCDLKICFYVPKIAIWASRNFLLMYLDTWWILERKTLNKEESLMSVFHNWKASMACVLSVFLAVNCL